MATTTWVLDPTHSEVQFKVKHLVISTVTGSFKQFEGQAVTNGEGFENAQVRFTAKIDSIDTNQEQRDEHLKGADFFDAATYPELTVVSTSFVKTGDDEFKLTADVTLHGVTKSVVFDVEYGGEAGDFYGNHKAGFDVTGKISRKDFGLTWSGVTEAGSIVVSDDVKLSASLQFAKQAEAVAV
ncbi:Polyisoprenoid-binding protein YceI [Hymenobacter gelipurpurascens]|uniref:Polyisoprenoid-binding protein YceI n=1 Tax=Hymenobacter gelipurpurascens TaxID=89968 RepID=A0A212UC48_9BACT|nr:YceI family protein [Hymenobacter gelipurpurascens]SNC75815.1 Polyisoprenoid-binding protein YceI [Hymenobacter gelipurpurascens]